MTPPGSDGKPLDLTALRWLDEQGEPVTCVEKLKVLQQTLEGLRQEAQDALEDAILMGCAEAQMRDVLARIVGGLSNPYRK
jgi:hypothetical protein